MHRRPFTIMHRAKNPLWTDTGDYRDDEYTMVELATVPGLLAIGSSLDPQSLVYNNVDTQADLYIREILNVSSGDVVIQTTPAGNIVRWEVQGNPLPWGNSGMVIKLERS